MRLNWLGLGACLGLVACSQASVKGEVEGESVPAAKSAIFDEISVTVPLIGTQDFLIVIITDIPNACDAVTDLVASSSLSCDDTCAELVAFNDTYLNNDSYYLLNFALNAGTDAVREYQPDIQLQQAGNFLGSYSSFDSSAIQDEETCVSACEQDGETITTDSLGQVGGGSLEITGYKQGERLKGKFDVTLDGTDSLKGSFVAEPCSLGDVIGLN